MRHSGARAVDNLIRALTGQPQHLVDRAVLARRSALTQDLGYGTQAAVVHRHVGWKRRRNGRMTPITYPLLPGG